jgi:hypothetical protein
MTGDVARRSALVRNAVDSFGPEDLDTVKARVGLALALGADGHHAAAAREATEVVRLRSAVLGATDPVTIQARRQLVGHLVQGGEWDRVVAEYPSIIEASRAVWGSRSERTIGARVNYGISLKHAGRTAEAEAELRDALPSCVERFGDDHVVTEACREALR